MGLNPGYLLKSFLLYHKLQNIGRNRKTNLKQRSMSSGLADWQYFSLDLSSWQNLFVGLLSALPTSALTAKSAKIAVIAKIAKIGLIFIATRVSTVVKFQRWFFFFFNVWSLQTQDWPLFLEKDCYLLSSLKSKSRKWLNWKNKNKYDK